MSPAFVKYARTTLSLGYMTARMYSWTHNNDSLRTWFMPAPTLVSYKNLLDPRIQVTHHLTHVFSNRTTHLYHDCQSRCQPFCTKLRDFDNRFFVLFLRSVWRLAQTVYSRRHPGTSAEMSHVHLEDPGKPVLDYPCTGGIQR